MEFIVYLLLEGAHREQCFFEHAEKGIEIGITFQVLLQTRARCGVNVTVYGVLLFVFNTQYSYRSYCGSLRRMMRRSL